ncbi:MAG: vWA domain-containing protein [Parcubacteria group bacterium]
MALWSTKRRFIYGGSTILVLAILFSAVFFSAFYRAPTCSDGKQNGEEKGVDCGGGCVNLCANDTLAPVVLWSKIFNISGDVYSAVAYVENPNISSKNKSAKYEFKVYDANNKLILTKEGETSVPKNKKFTIFETGLVIKSTKPKSADFKFTSFSTWEKDTTKEPDIKLKYGSLVSTTTSPRISGVISNESLETIPQSELTVFVLDGNENVVAASRTFIENLLAKTSQDFVFTWQKPFDLGVEVCANPVDVVVLLDKSGSMKSESINPPEPFGTVLLTAKEFVNNLNKEDQVSIVSFGTNAKLENELSSNKNQVISAIDNIFFSTTTNEQTNISEGLTKALNELKSENVKAESRKVIVLLTDGLPTMPTSTSTKDFPAFSAKQVAKSINEAKIDLYTIGLGSDVSEEFLKAISSSGSHYFFAPTRGDLANIYSKIASSLCVNKPNVITVIYRSL